MTSVLFPAAKTLILMSRHLLEDRVWNEHSRPSFEEIQSAKEVSSYWVKSSKWSNSNIKKNSFYQIVCMNKLFECLTLFSKKISSFGNFVYFFCLCNVSLLVSFQQENQTGSLKWKSLDWLFVIVCLFSFLPKTCFLHFTATICKRLKLEAFQYYREICGPIHKFKCIDSCPLDVNLIHIQYVLLCLWLGVCFIF